jgi:DNA ligase (NAD+)
VALVGDAIPQVVEVVGRALRKTASGPAQRQVVRSVSDACLRDSPVCRTQFLSRAVYFVSKQGLNIAGFGRGRMKKLVEAGLVTDLPSLFQLKEGEVAAVPGFGSRTASRLIVAIRAAGHSGSFKLVTALGIPGVGPKSVQNLARQFISLDALLGAKQEQLSLLSTSDIRTATTIQSFFDSPGGHGLLVEFRQQGIL